MNRISVLGVPIDAVTQREALLAIASLFTREGQFHIATPNPEMLVAAQGNPEFRKVLERTTMNLPDGVGLLWAARKQGTPLPERVTGTDTMEALCSLALRICPPERVFLLGGAPGVAERAAAALSERNPLLKIVGIFAGSPRPEEEADILRRINAAALAPHSSDRSEGGPTLLFVAYGAPMQDLWIARNLPKMRTVKVAMGVGGAFDFLAGRRKRAPAFLRSIGLEWLWRLCLEPRRIRRIWRAVVVFPWMVLMRSEKR